MHANPTSSHHAERFGPEIFASGALSDALSALAKPIVLKYHFPIVTSPFSHGGKPPRPHSPSSRQRCRISKGVPGSRLLPRDTWYAIVTIANGIISADYTAAAASANIADDQQFDIDSFRKLRELILPSLGAEAIPERTRKAFAEGLFKTSIIHAPRAGRGRPDLRQPWVRYRGPGV